MQDEEFVEQRRCLLDRYLQDVIAAGLGAVGELGQFVRPDSPLFPPRADHRLTAVTSLARSVGRVALWPFLVSRPDHSCEWLPPTLLFPPLPLVLSPGWVCVVIVAVISAVVSCMA